MLLIDKILADLGGDPASCKQIRPFDLRNLGYILTSRKIPVGSSTGKQQKFVIYEVVDEDTKRAVSFCYLFSKTTQMGIILKNTYDSFLCAEEADADNKKPQAAA